MGENDPHNNLVEKNKRLSSDLGDLSDKPSNDPNIMNKINLSDSENRQLTEDQSSKTDGDEKVKNLEDNRLIVINVRSAETEGETTKNEDDELNDEENVKVMIIDRKVEEKGEKEKTKENTEDSGPRRTGRKRVFNYLNSEHQDLRRTVRKGDPEVLKVFLKTISSEDIINIRDEEGNTVLNEISIKTAQFVEMAGLLIQHDADVNLADGMGNTPLHNSLLYYPATADMVRLLMESGANMDTKNISGSTPIQMSDDNELNSFVAKNLSVEPVTVLERWLNNTSDPITITGSPMMIMDSCPAKDSPRSILKGRRRLISELDARDENSTLIPVSKAIKTSARRTSAPGARGTSTTGARGTKRRRDSDEESELKRKRIRFALNDSLGACIDPEFSEDDI